MLINPFKEGISCIEGTPFVQDSRLLPYLGARVLYGDPRRLWSIQSFLLPPTHKAICGIRAKVQDQKGFITFCNQRDLEVLLGLGVPGQPCYWLGTRYVEPGDKNWVGFYAGEDDLQDDLYEQELLIRNQYPLIPEGMSVTRRIQVEPGVDVEETHVFLNDYDPVLQMSPDPRYETVHQRWARVERVRVIWEAL